MFKTKWQTDEVSDQMVNIVELLAAKEPNISFRSWWRMRTELKGVGILDMVS